MARAPIATARSLARDDTLFARAPRIRLIHSRPRAGRQRIRRPRWLLTESSRTSGKGEGGEIESEPD
jgi:hypothetical protein